MKVVFAKLNEVREPLVVNVTFPVETETGKQSESILTIWFEDDLLCEEILEAYQCSAIIGMLNEKLSVGTFLSDVPESWDYTQKYDKIDLKVYRGVELY
jgi:hypothetical protein